MADAVRRKWSNIRPLLPKQDDTLAIKRLRLDHLSMRLALALRWAAAVNVSRIARARSYIGADGERLFKAILGALRLHRMRLSALSRRFRFAFNVRCQEWDRITPSIRAHRREATQEAIRAIYGANGPPPGITEGKRFEQVNRWLRERGRAPVSQPTIRRAMHNLFRR